VLINAVFSILILSTLTTTQNSPYLEVYPLLFSPNDDGLADSLFINIHIPDNIKVAQWSINIWNSRDSLVAAWDNENQATTTISWDGYNREEQLLSNGPYAIGLKIITEDADSIYAPIHWFGINSIPPVIAVRGEPETFSPNGDDKLDSLIITPTLIGEIDAIYEISILDPSLVVKHKWKGNTPLPDTILWFGDDIQGQPLPDGIYYLELSMYHRGTYRHDTPLVPIEIKRRAPRLKISFTETEQFSPNADSIHDKIPILMVTNEYAQNYELSIADSLNNIVTIVDFNDSLPDYYFWDGIVQDSVLPEGTYSLSLTACDIASNCAKSNTLQTIIDTTPPRFTEQWAISTWIKNNSIKWEIWWTASEDDRQLQFISDADTNKYDNPLPPVIFSQPKLLNNANHSVMLLKRDAAGNESTDLIADGDSPLGKLKSSKIKQIMIFGSKDSKELPYDPMNLLIQRLCTGLVNWQTYKIICHGNCPNSDYMEGVRCGAALAGSALMQLLESQKLDARKLRAIGDNTYNNYNLTITIEGNP